MDKIKIVSDSTMIIDFDSTNVSIIQSEAGKSMGYANIIIPFDRITGIEFEEPKFIKNGNIIFIIDNKRMVKDLGKFNEHEIAHFFFQKSQFISIKSAIETISSRLNISIRSKLGYNVPKVQYDNSLDANESTEYNGYRKICNTCGNIFCYTNADLKENQRLNRSAALSAIGGIAGGITGRYASGAVSNQSAQNELSRIVDYNKCPKCGSTELREATDEELAQYKNKQSGANTVSSADEIKKYKDLLDSGVITQEEFDTKKKQLLGL